MFWYEQHCVLSYLVHRHLRGISPLSNTWFKYQCERNLAIGLGTLNFTFNWGGVFMLCLCMTIPSPFYVTVGIFTFFFFFFFPPPPNYCYHKEWITSFLIAGAVTYTLRTLVSKTLIPSEPWEWWWGALPFTGIQRALTKHVWRKCNLALKTVWITFPSLLPAENFDIGIMAAAMVLV